MEADERTSMVEEVNSQRKSERASQKQQSEKQGHVRCVLLQLENMCSRLVEEQDVLCKGHWALEGHVDEIFQRQKALDELLIGMERLPLFNSDKDMLPRSTVAGQQP